MRRKGMPGRSRWRGATFVGSVPFVGAVVRVARDEASELTTATWSAKGWHGNRFLSTGVEEVCSNDSRVRKRDLLFTESA